ncbi:MAG: cytochrome c [Chitinophagaceae bacterium]
MKSTLIFCALLASISLHAQTKKVVTHKKVAAKAPSPTGMVASIARGKAIYATSCLSCHQADGGGVPNLNPPLIQTKWVLGNKRELIQWVLKGSKGKVEIDGETFHNTMPPQAYLTDLQIADALTYIRNSFGNKASPVLSSEVKAARVK